MLVYSHQPTVSILLPSLNSQRFLADRLDSIISQKFANWELIVVDSYSDDGSWEIFQSYAKQDSRIVLQRAPKEGIYAGLNKCIDLACGKYLYIATSDDTMTPNCLDKMVSALDSSPECGLAHCCLTYIDENSDEIIGRWQSSEKIRFFGSKIDKPHLRIAPHDGILYCSLGTIYTSLTQLLIRRDVFDKIGHFKTQFGSRGDFEWGLRASLVFNTVHVPYELATWRIHPNQATQKAAINSAKGKQLACDMISSALSTLTERGYRPIGSCDTQHLLLYYQVQQFSFQVREKQWMLSKAALALSYILTHFNLVVRNWADIRAIYYGQQSATSRARKVIDTLNTKAEIKIL